MSTCEPSVQTAAILALLLSATSLAACSSYDDYRRAREAVLGPK